MGQLAAPALTGRFFITGHACDRFRERVAPAWGAHLTDAQVRQLLAEWLDQDGLLTRPLPEPGTWLVYVQQPQRFRVVIDARERDAERSLPTVVTVRHWKAPPRADLLAQPPQRERPAQERQATDTRLTICPDGNEPTTPKARRLWHIRAVVWDYAGSRTLGWMAAEIERRTGQSIAPRTVYAYCSALWASPTKHQGWLTTQQAADQLGITVQAVSRLCRVGKLHAHRNPTSIYQPQGRRGRMWLIPEQEAQRYAESRRRPTVIQIEQAGSMQLQQRTQREEQVSRRLAQLTERERQQAERQAIHTQHQQRLAAAKSAYLAARTAEHAAFAAARTARQQRREARAVWQTVRRQAIVPIVSKEQTIVTQESA